MHEHDERRSRSASVFSTSRIDSLHDRGRVERDWHTAAPAGRLRRAASSSAEHAGVDVERVGGRQRDDAEADGVASLEAQHATNTSRRRVRRVPTSCRRMSAPSAPACTMMFSNSDRLVEPARCAHAELDTVCPVGAGASPTLPAATLTFCSRSALTTSPAVSCARGQPHRIQPQPHRVLALAEDDDVGDAGHALQRVLDVDVDDSSTRNSES